MAGPGVGPLCALSQAEPVGVAEPFRVWALFVSSPGVSRGRWPSGARSEGADLQRPRVGLGVSGQPPPRSWCARITPGRSEDPAWLLLSR